MIVLKLLVATGAGIVMFFAFIGMLLFLVLMLGTMGAAVAGLA